jgi:ribosomal protein S17E
VFHLKKTILIAGLMAITALTGCSRDAANNDIYQESGNTINVNNKRAELYNEGGSRTVRNESYDYGYVRHHKSPIYSARTKFDRTTAINREQVAHIISKLSADLPNVNDVATLVTDQEVLVVYHTDAKDRNLAADRVKRTAMSVVPRYYHVYVSDNNHLIRDVQSLARLDSTSTSARTSVNQLVKQMKKSPQGDPMSKVEDENGLTSSDKLDKSRK